MATKHQKKMKAAKNIVPQFPKFEQTNAHRMFIHELEKLCDFEDCTAVVQSALHVAATRIIKDGEKAAKRQDRDATRLRAKLVKLNEEAKKAGLSLELLK